MILGRTPFFASVLSICLISTVRGQTDATSKLAKAANCFTLDLYKQLIQGQDNIICSPFSADIVLSMLLVGSGGSTAEELNKALGYTQQMLSLSDTEEAYKNVLSLITSSDGNDLNIENSLWIQTGFDVKSEFEQAVTSSFKATESELNFKTSPADSTNTINKWVSGRTNGLIPSLFDQPLSTNTLIVLVNAIYFKGVWEYKFNSSNTKNRNFYNQDDSNQPSLVPLMNQINTLRYRVDDTLNAQVLELDYTGNDTSMVLILPYGNSKLENVENSLECSLFEDGYQTESVSLVDVTMPKFNIESNFNLIKPLENLGITKIFNSGANFTGISSIPGLEVSQVTQKAIIKVDEDGSQAAAATGLQICKNNCQATGYPRPIIFNVDHPFIYFIRHNPSNIILFMGRVSQLP